LNNYNNLTWDIGNCYSGTQDINFTTAGTTDITWTSPPPLIDWLPNSCLYEKYLPTWHLVRSYK